MRKLRFLALIQLIGMGFSFPAMAEWCCICQTPVGPSMVTAPSCSSACAVGESLISGRPGPCKPTREPITHIEGNTIYKKIQVDKSVYHVPKSDNPPCGNGMGNTSICESLCIESPQKTKLTEIKLMMKDRGDHCDQDIPYKDCPQNAHCNPIGWAGIENYHATETKACATFKNWKHDWDRCAKIQGTLVPAEE